MYALIRDFKVIAYPYSVGDLRKDNPNTSFPMPMSDVELASFDILRIRTALPPAHDRLKQKAVESNPVMIDGIWTQVWSLVDLTSAESSAAFSSLVSEYEPKVTERLDNFAKTRGYTDALSCCTYATSNIEKYKTESQCMIDSRDITWFTFYQILNECKTGLRPTPYTFSDIEKDLPQLNWLTNL